MKLNKIIKTGDPPGFFIAERRNIMSSTNRKELVAISKFYDREAETTREVGDIFYANNERAELLCGRNLADIAAKNELKEKATLD